MQASVGREGGGEMALRGHNHRPGGVLILCHVGFSILKLFEHHSQTNFPMGVTTIYFGGDVPPMAI